MKKNKYFNEEKQKQAVNWLNSKWPATQRLCEVCGISSWTIAEDLVMPMPFVGGGLVVGGISYPQVMVICNNCGNTKYFNTVIMGVEKKGGNDESK
jgi:hypothetical protein